MTTRDGNPAFAAIDARLAAILDGVSPKPGWYRRWKALRPGSADERRLAVYQAIRDSGVVPADAGFYLVFWQIDRIVDNVADTALRHLDEHLKAIEQAHGLGEDEVWHPDEAPPEYQAALRDYHVAWDRLFADQLEKHGEPEMARLMREDSAECERRGEVGRRFFHGPLATELAAADDWLDLLRQAVDDAVEAESPMGPLAMRYWEDEGYWEVEVYPTPVELVGGADDGAIVMANFSLDIERLRTAFERIDDSGWNALGWHDSDGPFIWIEGQFLGRDVWLRVLAMAPEGEEPGAKLRLTRERQG